MKTEQRILPSKMRETARWFPVHVSLDKATGKYTKKPALEWSKPANWKTYAELEGERALGFALGDGFFGIDLDNCLDESGAITPERKDLVNDVLDMCPSFTEISWSGKGLHVYGYGEMPAASKDATPGLEMYSEKRFFLVTGRPFDPNDLHPLRNIQEGIEKLYAKYGTKPRAPNPKNGGGQSIGEGHRSNTIFSRASTLYKLGYSAKSVIAAMLEWNREYCRPPLPDDAVVKQCEDRYPEERFSIEETELPKRLGDFLLEARRRMERRASGEEAPIKTPWPDINDQLGGGLWPGLHVLVSGTGTGKSTWALQLGLASAKEGTPVAYIGLELDELQVALRLIGEEAGVSWSRLYTGTPIQNDSYDEVAKATGVMDALSKLPLHLVTGGPMGWAPSELETVAATMRTQYPETDGAGSLPMLIVLDFLQIIGKEPSERARVDLRERIGQAAYLGRRVAPKYNAVVLMISSVARDKYGIVSGDLSDAGLLEPRRYADGTTRRPISKPDTLVGLGKESGEIEYAADSVNVMVRIPDSTGDTDDWKSPVIFATPKHRPGGAWWCDLRFNGYRFSESPDDGTEALNALRAAKKQRSGRGKKIDTSKSETQTESKQVNLDNIGDLDE